MRVYYLFTFLIVLAIGAVYWYKATSFICPAPLNYSLGFIDPAFNLAEEDILLQLAKAETYWESNVNRELFVYNEAAPFKVNFIFDERQQHANDEEVLREDLDSRRAESEEIKKVLDKLQSEYDDLVIVYERQVESYEVRLQEYNNEVNKYNDRGGAPADIYERLEEEREILDGEFSKLRQTESKLSNLASEINSLGERGNQIINSYNKEVDVYNHEFGQAREFTQGDYQGNSINIYKFSSNNELQSVLAHEFGHSLGIGHVENPASVMYYLLENTENTPVLSADDLKAYYEVCGTRENWEQKIRRLVREFLIEIN